MNGKQTIKIFLAEGNPTGLRILELLGFDTKGVIFTRESFSEALKREELNSQGVYFLYSETEENGPALYVGESESIANRIKEHNRSKEFWDVGICFVSSSQSLSKAHVKYLEEMLIEEVEQAGRVRLMNGRQKRTTKLPESDEEWMSQFAENIKLILSSVGYTFLKKPTEYEEKNDNLYVCQSAGLRARGMYSSEGMVVLAGSDMRRTMVNSGNESLANVRQRAIDSGAVKEVDDTKYNFVKDYLFRTPSGAAGAVMGRNINGWLDWKRENDGKTLDEIFRQD